MNDESSFYDHYKVTNEKQQSYIHKRDILTIYLLCCVAFFMLILNDPQKTTEAFNKIVFNGVDFQLEFSYINTILIYVTCWIVLQYYQICLTIENTYSYINELEEVLNKGDFKVTREGKSYSENYSWLKNVANFLYAWGVPILVFFLSVKKIDYHNIADAIGLVIITILSLLYFKDRNLSFDIQEEEEKQSKKFKWYEKIEYILFHKL